MSREIKFMAYNKKLKVLAPVMEWIANGRVGVLIHDSGPFLWREPEDIDLFQFTGLLDSEGKEIYEGHILKYKAIFYDYTGAVKYKAPSYEIDNGISEFKLPLSSNMQHIIEIIGHIAEKQVNPKERSE